MVKRTTTVEPPDMDTNNITAENYVQHTDDFDGLVAEMRANFTREISTGTHLFTVKFNDLYEIFINHIPNNRMQYYRCNACKQFLNRFGGIVKIVNGLTVPVLWNSVTSTKCSELKSAVVAVCNVVSAAPIEKVFVSPDKNFGVEKNKAPDGKEWTHFHTKNPFVYKNKLQSAEQFIAEKTEDFKMLSRALDEYDTNVVETAVTLLSKDALFRGEKVLGIAQWFFELKNKLDKELNIKVSQNLIWDAVSNAPAGFCHVRSSMIGTLLDDIKSGDYDLDDIKNRFAYKMNPLIYARPQAAPAKGNIKNAEKIVEKLGIKNSFLRRYAKIEEIQTIWMHNSKRFTKNEEKENQEPGIFSDIVPKEKTKKITTNNVLSDLSNTKTVISWEKFRKNVLPTAVVIEYFVPSSTSRNSYGAITTAQDMDAPPVLQWDSEENRNPFSAYCYVKPSLPSEWNLKQNTFVNVNAIAYDPWMWGDENGEKFAHQGKGVIFIIDNCKDMIYADGIDLFPETLRKELHQIRATIEAYSNKSKFSGQHEASACGLRFGEKQSNRKPEDHIFRVTDKSGVKMTYKLDRWD